MTQIKKDKLTIVIPCKNEEKLLWPLISEIKKQLTLLSIFSEIILIDDGSQDNTWNTIKQIIETEQLNIKAFKFSKNFGKESAIRAGLEHASGDAAIIMDADLQHPPEMIISIYNTWKEKNVSIINCIKKETKRKSFIQDFGANFVYLLLKFVGLNLKNSSDFVLLDKQAYLTILSLKEYNTFFRGQVLWTGLKKENLYFIPKKQDIRKSNFNFIKLLNLGIDAITSFTIIPLRMMSFLGIFFILISFLLMIQTLFMYFTKRAQEGFSTVIILILLLGGFIILGLGIIGEYISKIYNEVKMRPKYLIQDKISKFS